MMLGKASVWQHHENAIVINEIAISMNAMRKGAKTNRDLIQSSGKGREMSERKQKNRE